jgi:hypothetical protein
LHRVRAFLYAFALVLALAPFSGIVVAAVLAPLVGCELNDAAGNSCSVWGFDVGGVLSSLVLTGGLAEIAFPILLPIFAIWVLIEIAAWLVRRRRMRREKPEAKAE